LAIQQIPWNLIYTGAITLLLSGILSYLLDRRKEKNRIKETRLDTYKSLIDIFSSVGIKDESQVDSASNVIKSQRRPFERDIKKDLPATFNGLSAHLSQYGTVTEPIFSNITFKGEGKSIEISLNGDEIKEDPELFFWFEDKKDMDLWIKIANKMLKSYNKHDKDNLKVEEWKFRLILNSTFFV